MNSLKLISIATLVCLSLGGVSINAQAQEPAAVVAPIDVAKQSKASLRVIKQFQVAFEKRDLAAIGELLADDLRWHSLNPKSEFVSEIDNKAKMLEWLGKYFKSNADVSTKASNFVANGPFVSFVETARWTTAKGEKRAASSLAVYQIEQSKVTEVWYYPAVRK